MRRRTSVTDPAAGSRAGFTLIELLVVIVILAMLVGLLLPAIMGAVKRANQAAVTAEINALSQALEEFHSKYGTYPPSRIVVSETGNYSAANLGTYNVLAQRSMAALRKIFPRIQLSTTGAIGPGYDVNGNNVIDAKAYVLTGPECLVLFLGGIPQKTDSGWAVTGFSKNPVNPFENNLKTTNRTPSLFEFNNARLVPNAANLDNTVLAMPGYLDSLGAPSESTVPPFYCYFSAYSGVGYDPGDVDFKEPSSDGNIASIQGSFRASNAPGSVASSVAGVVVSPAPNPYTTSSPILAPQPPTWVNPNKYQIISAGTDRLFGIGGQFVSNGNDRLPLDAAVVTASGQALPSNTRTVEKDNLTNFASGTLD